MVTNTEHLREFEKELRKGMVTDWSKYNRRITLNEMKCKHTGLCYIQKEFVDNLYDLRMTYNKPMTFTSGYRWVTHPNEIVKSSMGDHPKGLAVDIKCWSDQAFVITELAMKTGYFNVIGISQSPSRSARFIHLAHRPELKKGQGILYSY